MVQFMNSEHEKKYYSVLARMRSTDCYHRAIAYLFTLDSICKNHISEVYDFKEDIIKTDGLHSGWQTGTSVKTTRLAFNLWNGFIEKGEEKRFTPNEIFASTYAKGLAVCDIELAAGLGLYGHWLGCYRRRRR